MRAYLTMLPRLRAQETLAVSNAVALGSGTVPQRSAHRYMAWLERTAAGGRVAHHRQPPSPAVMAAMGIAVVVTPSNDVQTPLEGEPNG